MKSMLDDQVSRANVRVAIRENDSVGGHRYHARKKTATMLSTGKGAATLTVWSVVVSAIWSVLFVILGSGAVGANGGVASKERTRGMPSGENVPSLVIRAEDTNVPLGRTCKFFVELHNTGSSHLTIYMPGLTCRPEFKSHREQQTPRDRDGLPISYGRLAHQKAAADFVVLEPGDYYGRVYEWDPLDLGTVAFACQYKNAESGKDVGVPAWIGETSCMRSPEVRITGGAESLALLEKQMDQTGLSRVIVIRKLGHLGEKGAVPVLLRALNDETVVKGERRFQDAAAFALQELAGEDLGLPRGMEKVVPEKHLGRVREWAEKYVKDNGENRDAKSAEKIEKIEK